ncbi:hypothetical protein [Bacillus thuringiensis]|uniref:hypothetical protein n=1 Tax=Bacillus thuringiensis TaxID=1428 RepID=UPI000BFD347F|nr:hypothetical protein [Bacillus thuringiensis]PGT89848.1 hypothetical protein COD17_08855 [Bacillus thuringiensis]
MGGHIMFGAVACENCGNVHPARDMRYHKDLDKYFCKESCEYEYIADNIQVHEDVDEYFKENGK